MSNFKVHIKNRWDHQSFECASLCFEHVPKWKKSMWHPPHLLRLGVIDPKLIITSHKHLNLYVCNLLSFTIAISWNSVASSDKTKPNRHESHELIYSTIMKNSKNEGKDRNRDTTELKISRSAALHLTNNTFVYVTRTKCLVCEHFYARVFLLLSQ